MKLSGGVTFMCDCITQAYTIGDMCSTTIVGRCSLVGFEHIVDTGYIILTETGNMLLENQLVYVGDYNIVGDTVTCRLILKDPIRRIT